jgi:hypothetical protein
MTPSDRNAMTLSQHQHQHPQRAQRLRPRARSQDPPRFKHRVKNEYPVGYLAQLARPFTSRRAGGDEGLDAGLGERSLAWPAR